MESNEALIISAYKKLKQQMDEQIIKETDQVWDEFLELARKWPNQKAALLDYSVTKEMKKIAAVGSGGNTARENFKIFLGETSITGFSVNIAVNSDSICTMNSNEFQKLMEENQIEEIITLAVKLSLSCTDIIFDRLSYIDVLFKVIWDRMLNYPHYTQRNRPLALTKRLFNSIFSGIFTTIVNERNLNRVASKLGISTKEAYVYKQMHIRKMVNDCLDKHYPGEDSYFVRAAVAWWI